MAGNSWYDTGYAGLAGAQAQAESKYGPNRFWLKEGMQKDVVFVDDEPFCIYEHNPKINGDFKNWLTCMSGSHDDVVCCQKLGPNSKYYCGYLTVVDCSEWVDDKGNKHQFELKLLAGKMRTLKVFRRKKEDRGAMAGCVYGVARDDGKSPSCGNEFEYKRNADMEKLFALVNYRGKKLSELWDEAERDPERMISVTRTFNVKPREDGKLPRIVPSLNYMELLRPKDPKAVRLLLVGVDKEEPGGYGNKSRFGGNSGGGGSDSDNVPF